jgi:hypothetical protein
MNLSPGKLETRVLLQNFIEGKKNWKILLFRRKKTRRIRKNSSKMDVSSGSINPHYRFKKTRLIYVSISQINPKELYKRLESFYIILHKK